ncbi:E3 ubiquitin-protein ligase FANCL-like isoform X2 [Pomacea canaliculata]|uniref:E3 ubiquitin-protein ligase FANCL-like isoform X2 n=1 Tax=Pomacea canaliculata TaxID=400727 RepID=UPI000D73331C|nr:E3 ubiquitin-protein ligase FANCL-like isoform X2 [Pomacea canaliculata]
MDLLKTFPCLLPAFSTEGIIFDGFLTTDHGNEYRIRIRTGTPDAKTHKGFLLECDWRLHNLLESYTAILEQRSQQCKDVQSFLKELKSIVERLTVQKSVTIGTFTHTRRIIEEMEKIGWEKLVNVDASFQHLTLQAEDAAGRQHHLQVFLSTQESMAPRCVADLPSQFVFYWSAQGHLSDLMHQFEATLASYQPLWNALADVDQHTWVLEPDVPTYSAIHRRIVLGPCASVQIVLDLRHPTSVPECRFLGADQIVNPLKDKINKNLHVWDDCSSLVCNLENLLGISFPSPTNSKKEDFSLECGICYSYRLEDEIPDKACDDARCGQPFHVSCLYEWMRSLPSCQQSFNTIFGECPLCSKPLTIKVPTKT